MTAKLCIFSLYFTNDERQRTISAVYYTNDNIRVKEVSPSGRPINILTL